MIHKNIAKFYKIYLELMKIFEKLDKKLFCKLEIYKNPKTQNIKLYLNIL